MRKKNANLIIQTAFLGDCILTFPLIEKIHKKNPDQELIFLCRKGFGEFIESCFPFVTALEVVKSSTKSYKKAQTHLSTNFDLNTTFCVHKSFRSMRFCAKLKARQQVHYTDSYRRFLVSGPKRNMEYPEVLRILQQYAFIDPQFEETIHKWFLENLNCKSPSQSVPDFLKTSLPISNLRPFDIPERYIVLAPGSVWKTKKWPAQKFATISKLIKDELDLAVIILGSPEEAQLGNDITALSPYSINLIGQTSLVDCMNIISNGQGFIGNDSGLIHLAATFEVPSVAIFGPTHESLGFRPWQDFAAIASLNLECSPCGTHGGKQCPLKTHDCMKNLEAQHVFSHLKRVLNKKKTSILHSNQISL